MSAEVHHITLRNGMRLLARRNTANPTVSLQLSFAAGAVDDPRGKVGLANFARALLTKGTARHNAAWIAERIDDLGLELGFSSGRHTLGLGARVLAENLRPALKLIREIIAEPQPPAEEFEKMRARIATAIRRRLDDPASVAGETLAGMIYGPRHPYGLHSQGTLKSIEKILLDDVLSFYEKSLEPGAAIAVVVGDVEPAEVEILAGESLGRWQGGGEFVLEPPKSVELPVEPQRRFVVMPEKTQNDVALGYQGIKRLDPDYHALQIGNTVLGRLSLGGRIGQRVRDREGMAYYAYTGFDAGVGAGPFVFRAGVAPQNVDRAVEIALEEMRSARGEGITAEEMEDAVLYLSGGVARQVETNAGMASTLLSQEIFDLGDDHYLRYESILRELTLGDVNAALSKHLHPDNYCLAVAGAEV
ncbi:MAG TPA: pitrilysin family protein [Acidobacteriota bacterium]|nr:pitrilysin family protein [Acidobacteriota bacterium]